MVMQCVRASLLFVGCISILAGSAVALCPAGQFYNVSSASSVVPSGMRLRWTKNAPAEEIKTGKYAVRWVIELNPEGVAINKAGSAEGNLFLEAEAGSPRFPIARVAHWAWPAGAAQEKRLLYLNPTEQLAAYDPSLLQRFSVHFPPGTGRDIDIKRATACMPATDCTAGQEEQAPPDSANDRVSFWKLCLT